MDFAELPPLKSWESRDLDLLIVGIKQPTWRQRSRGISKILTNGSKS